ncbi:MAG: hypothetical protein Q9219_001141 [cf. Caloplaca sp. 3 TL-2023]
MESVSDPEEYLSKWFKGAPLSEIRRENVKQFFCWSLLNKDKYGLLDDQELEEYADQVEAMLGRKLQPGMGSAKGLRLTLDKVQILYRPLIWYLVSFLANIPRSPTDQSDEETGVIAVEIMPISFRITHEALARDEMKEEILKIVRHHGWKKFVLVAHSYGSIVATHLLQDPNSSRMVEATLLVDPVSILLHLPDVAYNFTCRAPAGANEHQLYYFASMDMGVAHTLARKFFWQENVLWKHDLQGRRVTVVLCGKDLIVNTKAVGRYLARAQDTSGRDPASTDWSWQHQKWEGDGLDVIWYRDLDHSQVFEKKSDYKQLVEVIHHYTLASTASNGRHAV